MELGLDLLVVKLEVLAGEALAEAVLPDRRAGEDLKDYKSEAGRKGGG